MKQSKDIMGMPVTVEIRDGRGEPAFNMVFGYFKYIDEVFSPYKQDSAISKINRGELREADYSADVREIFLLAERTKKETDGYFNIKKPDGSIDPSGIVKGWAIWQAALLLEKAGYEYFFIEAGGDIQARVPGTRHNPWRVGIRNPFNKNEIVKVVGIADHGMATSGTYERGQHIYNPHEPKKLITEISSLTVIGPNVYQADRFATAAFAMGKAGINFIEGLPGLEGYIIDSKGIATETSGFAKYALS